MHIIFITLLADMGVQGWLLKVTMAFLKEREMILRYIVAPQRKKSYLVVALKDQNRDYFCSFSS